MVLHVLVPLSDEDKTENAVTVAQDGTSEIHAKCRKIVVLTREGDKIATCLKRYTEAAAAAVTADQMKAKEAKNAEAAAAAVAAEKVKAKEAKDAGAAADAVAAEPAKAKEATEAGEDTKANQAIETGEQPTGAALADTEEEDAQYFEQRDEKVLEERNMAPSTEVVAAQPGFMANLSLPWGSS